VYVFGRSIGGAVGIYGVSTTTHPVRGLIVENTFTSVPEVVTAHIPYISTLINLLVLRNKWPSLERVGTIKCPILFINGESDELIPPRMTSALRNAATASRFTMHLQVPRGGHNDTYMIDKRQYLQTIKEFFTEA
jgi:fermentation-respiration switch protein FrsA (DUF1100 family)